MSKRIDLTGKRFNTLKVIEFAYQKNTHAYWKVECTKCGFTKISSSSNLINGMTDKCNYCSAQSRAALTPEQKESIKKEYAAKTKITVLAKKYGVVRSTIYSVLKSTNTCQLRKNELRSK